jgi:DNA-binding NtrC family response regulator
MTTPEKTGILVVDDENATARLLASFFDDSKFQVTLANSEKQAASLLMEHYFPIILADMDLGSASGLTLIPLTKQADKPSLIIFVTGHGKLSAAVKAIDEGAFDYISKSDDIDEMKAEINHRVERALRQLKVLEKESSQKSIPTKPPPRSIIGESPPMVNLYRTIAKSARSRGNVLIHGESGTGKELVARAIHDNGPLSDKPFVTVNCGALTETLLESELFGHIKGAFTGAVSNKKGLFEEADEGTLFLDEIGDVPLPLQVKLLRAIQEGEIKPVGATENRTVKVRIIAATHRDLESRIEDGAFREDLYYRLKVFQLEVPPLRERKQDIPELINYFISRLESVESRQVRSVSEEALRLLMAYSWPGNIRELENAVEHASGMANSQVLYPDDFPSEITHPSTDGKTEEVQTPLQSINFGTKSLEEVEKEHIARVLASTHYNKSKAAEILKIDRGTLYRKVIQYGILLEKSAGDSEVQQDSSI